MSPIGWCWVTPMLHSCGDCQLQLGVDGINEALSERWAGTRDWTCAVPEEMRLAQCASVCFLAARKRSSSGLSLDFSFMCAIELNLHFLLGTESFYEIFRLSSCLLCLGNLFFFLLHVTRPVFSNPYLISVNSSRSRSHRLLCWLSFCVQPPNPLLPPACCYCFHWHHGSDILPSVFSHKRRSGFLTRC